MPDNGAIRARGPDCPAQLVDLPTGYGLPTRTRIALRGTYGWPTRSARFQPALGPRHRLLGLHRQPRRPASTLSATGSRPSTTSRQRLCYRRAWRSMSATSARGCCPTGPSTGLFTLPLWPVCARQFAVRSNAKSPTSPAPCCRMGVPPLRIRLVVQRLWSRIPPVPVKELTPGKPVLPLCRYLPISESLIASYGSGNHPNRQVVPAAELVDSHDLFLQDISNVLLWRRCHFLRRMICKSTTDRSKSSSA